MASTGQLGTDPLGTLVLGGEAEAGAAGAGFDPCGAYLGAKECEVRIYDEAALSVPVDVYLVFDISPSMLTAYGSTTRLAAAKSAIGGMFDEMIAADNGSRIGLVTFSYRYTGYYGEYGDYYHHDKPLTIDVAGVQTYVNALSTGSATATGTALDAAVGFMEAEGGAGHQPIVIVVSDGEWNRGIDPIPVATALKADHPTWLLYAVDINDGTPNPSNVSIGEIGDGFFSATDPASLTSALHTIIVGTRKGALDAPRKYLAVEDWLESVETEQLEQGGCGAGTLNLLAPWDELQFVGGERVDIDLFGDPLYRGWIDIPQNDVTDPERVTARMFGLMGMLDRWEVKRKFAYGCATDLSTVFTDIVNHAVKITDRLPTVELDTETIGVTLYEFDARGKSVAQALNQLSDLAPADCIWGGGFSATADWRGRRENRLYFKKRNLTVTQAYAVGDNVSAFTYPRDTSRIQNKFRLVGGAVNQENLAQNGGFEEVVPASEDAGNLLINPGFEDSTSSTSLDAPWHSGGGSPSPKWAGEGGAFGAPRTGQKWLECDAPGEAAYQDVFPIAGQPYVGSCWARLEDVAQPNAFTITLQGLTLGNALVAQEYASFDSGTTPPLDDIYRRFTTPTLDLSLYPTVAKLRLIVQSNSGSEANDGVLFDDCGVYEDCAAAQQLWRAVPTGNATIAELDWAYSGPVAPRNGGLCVRIKCAGSGVGTVTADTGELYTMPSESPSVTASERYTLIVFWHVNGEGTSGDAALSIGAVNIRSDNTQSTVVESGIISGNPADWTAQTLPITTDRDCAKLQLFIRSRTTRNLYIDDVMLVEGEAPADVLDHGVWWSGSAFEATIDVENADLVGLTDEAAASITTWGVREPAGGVQVDGVTDYASLLSYAVPHFNATAVPEINGSLTLYGPRRQITQDGRVRIIGLPNGPQSLFPARIQYKIGESIEASADLGSRIPDLNDLLNLLQQRNARATFGGSTGTTSASGTGGGGGSAATLTVEEVDGSPVVAGVRTLRVPNGSLTDDGSGQATLSISSGGSAGGGWARAMAVMGS